MITARKFTYTIYLPSYEKVKEFKFRLADRLIEEGISVIFGKPDYIGCGIPVYTPNVKILITVGDKWAIPMSELLDDAMRVILKKEEEAEQNLKCVKIALNSAYGAHLFGHDLNYTYAKVYAKLPDTPLYVRDPTATVRTEVDKITRPAIKTVHFSGPVTCVIWMDGTKTIVRAQNGEKLDPEKGLAMAVCKKVLGTNASGSNYYDIFKQCLPKEEK